MANRKGPPRSWLIRMLAKNPRPSYQEMADAWAVDPENVEGHKVSRYTIGAEISREGLSEERTKYRFTAPWSPIKNEHSAMYVPNMLRYREQQLQGKKVSERNAARVDAFLTRLDEINGIVAYAPDNPDQLFPVLDRDEIPAELVDDDLPIVTERLPLGRLQELISDRNQEQVETELGWS